MKKDIFYFSSEKYPLTMLSCDNIKQVFNDEVLVDIPISKNINITDYALRKTNLIPKFIKVNSEAKLLEYPCPVLRRCTRCILPETMPYISFDDHGVCNYCRNYKTRNNPKPKEELLNWLSHIDVMVNSIVLFLFLVVVIVVMLFIL